MLPVRRCRRAGSDIEAQNEKNRHILHIIASIGILAVLAQPSSKAVHKALSPFVEQRQIGGVVAVVADRDKIISMDCLGYADIENNRKMSGGVAVLDRVAK